MRIKITTGDIENYEVEADSIEEAFKEAVLAHPDAMLGLIYEAQVEGEEERYGHTMRTLNRVGLTDQALDEDGLPIWNEEDIDSDDILDTQTIH